MYAYVCVCMHVNDAMYIVWQDATYRDAADA